MDLLSLRQVRQATVDSPCQAAVQLQVERVQVKPTKSGSEYLELKLADAEDHLVMRVWGDAPGFPAARALATGAFIAIAGEWSSGTYGLEPKQWTLRLLSDGNRNQAQARLHCNTMIM